MHHLKTAHRDDTRSFQQWTGINAILFYAPQLFSSLGSSSEAALLNAVIIGAVKIVSPLVAVLTVDRLGRRSVARAGKTRSMVRFRDRILATLDPDLDLKPYNAYAWVSLVGARMD